jgi:hypothetical protein
MTTTREVSVSDLTAAIDARTRLGVYELAFTASVEPEDPWAEIELE